MNKLKISINVEYKEGPWGGGNLFIANLKNYLESQGNEVIFNLFASDIDIILIIDPRMLSENVSYSVKEIKFYKSHINKNCKVVHRINECDERKNTTGLNDFYIKNNLVADYTIFVSNWLKNVYLKSGYSSTNYDVIMSGANNEVFNNSDRAIWNQKDPLRIITHHWGNDLNKGFDVYCYLDRKIQEKYKDEIIFTYIGNLNNDIHFNSTIVHEPKFGEELASLIKENHVYLTASINEPSGNHHIEGAQCGLPILYRNSGGMPEFTKGYGIGFKGMDDFFESLDLLKIEYLNLFNKMENYPYNSSSMCKDYLNLFKSLNTLPQNTEKFNNKTKLEYFLYLFNKFLNLINMYKLKVKIKKFLLIKFPLLKEERNVV